MNRRNFPLGRNHYVPSTAFAIAVALGLSACNVWAQAGDCPDGPPILWPSVPQADEGAGYSVALDGDLAAVGAPWHYAFGDWIGRVMIFRIEGGAWVEEEVLYPSPPHDYTGFGVDVALDGNRLVVGTSASGSHQAAYVFERDPLTHEWSLQARLQPPDLESGDQFGVAVAIDGDRIMVGAYGDAHPGYQEHVYSGSVYVYERSQGGTWNFHQKLVGPAPPEFDGGRPSFGWSVAMQGDRAFISCSWYDSAQDGTGYGYVFERNRSGLWQVVQPLVDPDQPYVEDLMFDMYNAHAIDLDGDRIVVGANWTDDAIPVTRAGWATVFKRTNGAWTREVRLTAPQLHQFGNYGRSVAIEGDVLLIGSYGQPWDTHPYAGVVHWYELGDQGWSLERLIPSPLFGITLGFGMALDISGDRVLVGTSELQSANGLRYGGAVIHERFTQPDDCNHNSIPDSCEPDCNMNGIPDDCDVTSGASDDLDHNGYPDDCEGLPECVDEAATILQGIDLPSVPDQVILKAFDVDQDRLASVIRNYPLVSIRIHEHIDGEWQLTTTLPLNPSGDFVYVEALDLDGEWLAVAFGADNTSEVRMYRRNAGEWNQHSTFVVPPGQPSTSFGTRLVLTSDHFAILQSSASYFEAGRSLMYRWNGTAWSYLHSITIPPHSPVSIDMSGDSLVTAIGDNRTGTAGFRWYRFNGTAWTLMQTVQDYDEWDSHSNQIAMHGEWLAMAVPVGDQSSQYLSSEFGYIDLYKQMENAWVFQQRLEPPDNWLRERFGASLDMNDGTLVASSPFDGDNGYETGSAYVFQRQGDKWSLGKKIFAASPQWFGRFGTSVKLNGDKAYFFSKLFHWSGFYDLGQLLEVPVGECSDPADIAPLGGDGVVNVQDLLAVIAAWGACASACPPSCVADLAPAGGNCLVNVQDLLFVIANWG